MSGRLGAAGRGGIAVAITVLSFASAFPLIRLALGDLEPLPLAAARFALCTTILLPLLVRHRVALPGRADVARFLVTGLFGIALYNALLNLGQQTVTASAASFIINTSPLFTALLAAAFLGERFGTRVWAGTATCVSGVALIALAQPGGLSFGAGSTLVLAAALCQAIFFVLQRPLVQRHGVLITVAYTLLAGSLLLSPWLPAAMLTLGSGRASAQTWAALAALAIVPTLFGYASWAYVLRQFGAARAANFLYLVPPTATVLAIPITGELPALLTLLGGAVAIAGVAMVNLGRASGARTATDAPRPPMRAKP